MHLHSLLITAICLSVSAHRSLLPRESSPTCAQNTSHCAGSGLPADFCCPAGSDCVVLAANTTVLCCPQGSSCDIIRPITCDLQQQNSTAFPRSVLKTTALTGTLGFCGIGCCPFGYACDGSGNCARQEDQATAPVTSAPVLPSASAGARPSGNSTLSSQPDAQASDAPGSPFPTGAVLGGIFGGLVFGIALAILLVWFYRRRKRNAATAPRRNSSPTWSTSIISDPKPIHDIRTDFLRRVPNSPDSVSTGSPRQPARARVKSLLRKSGITSTPVSSVFGGRTPPSMMPTPSTGPMPVSRQMQRHDAEMRQLERLEQQQQHDLSPHELPGEPKYLDINIFADNDTATSLREREHERPDGLGIGDWEHRRHDARSSTNTTFSDMMEESGLAGLTKGQRKSICLAPSSIERN